MAIVGAVLSARAISRPWPRLVKEQTVLESALGSPNVEWCPGFRHSGVSCMWRGRDQSLATLEISSPVQLRDRVISAGCFGLQGPQRSDWTGTRFSAARAGLDV